MAGRKNFPSRVKARRERALYNWEHPREDSLPDEPEKREKKIAYRKEQIVILRDKLSLSR